MDASVIETVEAIRRADPGNMLDRIKDLPKQLRDSLAIASAASLPPSHSDVRSIVVLGMGGSAIGGELAGALLADELKVPMLVHRDYSLPAFVGRDTLVIASSYSGNTEETLTALGKARASGARILALTTGGALRGQCEKDGTPVITFAYRAQPRAALGYSLGLMLGALAKLGLVRDRRAEVEAALADVARLEERTHEGAKTNDAKRLAIELHGAIPFVYGAGLFGVLARRVKGQINENGKNWAAFDVMSELNHNAVVGFPNPEARGSLIVLNLESDRDDPRQRVRFAVTKELLDRAGVAHRTLKFAGGSLLSEALQMVYFTDYVTFYLALLNRADPSEVRSIDYLKERLSKGA
ncbi:MAG: bifunctional phosphoglucose/phosphomannose isomerase [Chloroflexi bacterium]|nr:bifunctional phosphoglucose/phosphomannose isomerase [Chloroflexota bacterium]